MSNFEYNFGYIIKPDNDMVALPNCIHRLLANLFENGYLKRDNVAGMFKFNNPEQLNGKDVIIFDDIFDSGATIKEIGKMLTSNGARKIAPLIIARTVGGDI